MRMRVTLLSKGKIDIPWNYLHYLHAFTYSSMLKIEPDLARFLHERGFNVEGHIYKLFNFSLLYPKRAEKGEDGLKMTPPILWWISSPLTEVIESLATFLLQENKVKIKNSLLEVERIEIEENPNLEGKSLFKTLSPIVVSTGVKVKDKLEHKFLSPEDKKFWEIAKVNLLRKAKALRLKVESDELYFEPTGNWRSKLLEVQGTKVRAFDVEFWAEGNPELLQVAYDCGLGERNAQGFGMIKLLEKKIRV